MMMKTYRELLDGDNVFNLGGVESERHARALLAEMHGIIVRGDPVPRAIRDAGAAIAEAIRDAAPRPKPKPKGGDVL